MNDNFVSLGLALNSAVWIAAWYRASAGKAAPRAAGWGRYGRVLGGSGFLAQLVMGAVSVGALAGAAIVLGAWMLLGLVFVLAVNASPARLLTAATWLGTVAGVSLAALSIPSLGR